MAELERIDQLTVPPIVGRYYLVPTVRGTWFGLVRNWPVIGGKHTDIEFFDFAAPHYHLDRRFIRIGRRTLNDAETSPLQESTPGRQNLLANDPLPPPVLRRLKCIRADMDFPTYQPAVTILQDHFAGTACKHGKAGWICPHRGFALGSIAPNEHGIIVCPMHGLQIDAVSGVVHVTEAA